MKINLRNLLIYIVLNIYFQNQIYSQRQITYIDGFSINTRVGVASVTGELGDLFTLKPNFNITAEKGISEKVNLLIDFNSGNLAGSETVPYNSRFDCNFFQVNFISNLHLIRLLDENSLSNNFSFKPYLGLGLIWFHTDVYDLNTGSFLRTTADGTTKHTFLFQQSGFGIGSKGIYYTRELVIPFGFVSEFKLNKRISTLIDLRYSWVYNDKLDATTEYNLKVPNKIGGINSYSNTANDGWLSLSMGIKYKFMSMKIMKQRGV
jgi:hypothetical protein